MRFLRVKKNISVDMRNLVMNNIVALIPAFNEEKTIETVIKKTLEQNVRPVVIDDGSKDKTYELASKWENGKTLIVRNRTNLGKGPTIMKGREEIIKDPTLLKRKVVVILDADMQYDPKLIKKLPPSIFEGKADISLGVRRDIPYLRHSIANKIWTFLFNLFFDYKDINGNFIYDICAIRAYSMRTFLNIDNFGPGYVTETCILVEAVKKGWKIDQFPVEVNYKQKSGFLRGTRMFGGIFIELLKEGVPFSLKRLKRRIF